MYLYMEGNSPYANVYVNGTYIGDYFSNETNCILYLGNFKQKMMAIRMDRLMPKLSN